VNASAAPASKTFRRDDRGTILPTFAFMLMGITLSAGVAIDYGRIHHANTRMTAAADAAAIAAGKALLDGRNSDAQVREIAQKFFEQNINGANSFAHISSFSAEIDRSTNTVTIHLESTVPTTIMKIAHVDQVSLPVTSAATFEQKDIELALALDVTGSMSGRKLRDLKAATKDLVDIMLPSAGTPNKVRIGFAPYSNGVNAGTYAADATGGRAPNGCTFERTGARPEEDHAPGPGSYLKGTVDVGTGCPTNAKVIGLTDDARLLKNSVEDYTAGGSTAGHMGAQWATFLVSPNWGGVLGTESRPAPYRDGKTVKAIVLMTDGEFNTWAGTCGGNCSPYSTNGRKSNDRAKEVCEAAKRNGVMVFTIGFELSHPVALETLGACATSTSHFFRAENGDQLRQAFAAIGQQLNNLRISK
jgi:Flp pilus assembly protein TadG